MSNIKRKRSDEEQETEAGDQQGDARENYGPCPQRVI